MSEEWFVISIDLAVAKLAVVVTDSSGAMRECTPYMLQKHKHKRYMDAMKIGYQLAKKYGKEGKVYAFPEEPLFWRGGRSTLPLAQVSGALIAGLLSGGATSVVEANNQTWKKEALGSAKLDKPGIARLVKKTWPSMYQYIAMTHTTGVHKPVPDQDLIDSTGINIYGHQVVKRLKRIERLGTTKRKLILRKKR